MCWHRPAPKVSPLVARRRLNHQGWLDAGGGGNGAACKPMNILCCAKHHHTRNLAAQAPDLGFAIHTGWPVACKAAYMSNMQKYLGRWRVSSIGGLSPSECLWSPCHGAVLHAQREANPQPHLHQRGRTIAKQPLLSEDGRVECHEQRRQGVRPQAVEAVGRWRKLSAQHACESGGLPANVFCRLLKATLAQPFGDGPGRCLPSFCPSQRSGRWRPTASPTSSARESERHSYPSGPWCCRRCGAFGGEGAFMRFDRGCGRSPHKFRAEGGEHYRRSPHVRRWCDQAMVWTHNKHEPCTLPSRALRCFGARGCNTNAVDSMPCDPDDGLGLAAPHACTTAHTWSRKRLRAICNEMGKLTNPYDVAMGALRSVCVRASVSVCASLKGLCSNFVFAHNAPRERECLPNDEEQYPHDRAKRRRTVGSKQGIWGTQGWR